jgi:hypothetical protein
MPACNCKNGAEDKENKNTNNPPSKTHTTNFFSYKNLTLTVDKKFLIGKERTVKVALDATKIAANKEDEEQVTSKKFKIKAFIKLEESTVNPPISYLKLSNTDKNKTAVETYLYIDKLQQHDGVNLPVTVNLEIMPGKGIKKVPVTLALYENDTDLSPIYSTEVCWQLNAHNLLLEGLSDLLINDETSSFSIKNIDTEPLDLKGATLAIAANQEIIFKFNGKVTPSISLQDLAQNNTTVLKPGENTSSIELQAFELFGSQKSDISLEIKKGTEVIFTRTIQWKKEPVVLQLIGLHDIIDDETLSFAIENSGNKPIDPKDIVLSLIATPDTKFRLQDRIVTSINLHELLPNSTVNLDKGIKTIPIKLQVDSTTGQKQSQLTLTIKKGNEQLGQQTINWKKQPVLLQFVGLHDITDNENLLFSIENNGNNPINTKDITLSLFTSPHVLFELQDKLLSSVKLQELLPNGTTSLAEKTTTIPIKLQLQNAYSHRQAKITLQVKQLDEIIDQQEINWHKEKEGVELEFVDFSKHNIVGDETLTFSITNQKDVVCPEEVLLYIENVNDSNSIQPTFSLNNIVIPSQGISLAKLFSNAEQSILGKGSKTELFTLQCLEPIRSKPTTIYIRLKKEEQAWTSPAIHWQNKVFNLSFKNIPNERLSHRDGLRLKIKNNGTRIRTEDILLFLNRPAQNNHIFKANNRSINKSNHISLAKLLPDDKAELEAGQEITIKITKEEINESSAIVGAALSLQLLSRDGSYQSTQAQVNWEPRINLYLDILKNDPTKEEEFIVHITNQGEDLNNLTSRVSLSVNKVQGDAVIPDLDKYQSYQYYQGSKMKYLYSLPISKLPSNASWNEKFFIALKSVKVLNEPIIYDFQLYLNRKPIKDPITVIWEPKKIDLRPETEEINLQGDNKNFTVRVLNQGDTLHKGEGQITLVIKKVNGEGSLLGLENYQVSREKYKFKEDISTLATGTYWQKDLTLHTTNQPVMYEIQVCLDETPIGNPLKVSWKPEPISLGFEVKTDTTPWYRQDFTVHVQNKTDRPIDLEHEIDILVTRIKGKGTVPKLEAFKLKKDKGNYLFIHPNFKLDPNSSWEDHLSIQPLDPFSSNQEPIIYELQLRLNKEKIGEPKQVKWTPKKINLHLEVDKQKLKGVENSFKFSIINQGDIFKELKQIENDTGTWMIGIERLTGDRATLRHVSGNISKAILRPQENTKYIKINSPLQVHEQVYELNFDHKGENKIKFEFSLIYKYELNGQIQEKVVGSLVKVAWQNSGTWKSNARPNVFFK